MLTAARMPRVKADKRQSQGLLTGCLWVFQLVGDVHVNAGFSGQ